VRPETPVFAQSPILAEQQFGSPQVQRRLSQRVSRPQTANAFGGSGRDSRVESAQWFNSLPEKVRRQHFSSQEQELLASGLDHWVTTSGQASKRNSRTSVHRFSTHIANADCIKFDTEEMESVVPRAPQPRDSVKRTMTFSRPSFHKATSSISSNFTATIPLPSFAHNRERSRAGTLIGLSRPSVDTSVIDPDALYYQSPEARTKLRQYLASPQKFDEALTYGFPAVQSPITTASTQDDEKSLKSPMSTSNNDAQAFLQSDSIDFLDKSEVDEVSSGTTTSDNDTDSPATPDDPDWTWRTSKYNRLSIFGGINTDSMPSLDLKFQTESLGFGKYASARDRATSPVYSSSANSMSTACLPSPGLLSPMASPLLMNREMTLRMTLTRPDLRANDDELYGWQAPRDSIHKRRNVESRTGMREESLLSAELASVDETASQIKAPKGKILFRRMIKKMRIAS
jgi:hypothetical protein